MHVLRNFRVFLGPGVCDGQTDGRTDSRSRVPRREGKGVAANNAMRGGAAAWELARSSRRVPVPYAGPIVTPAPCL